MFRDLFHPRSCRTDRSIHLQKVCLLARKTRSSRNDTTSPIQALLLRRLLEDPPCSVNFLHIDPSHDRRAVNRIAKPLVPRSPPTCSTSSIVGIFCDGHINIVELVKLAYKKRRFASDIFISPPSNLPFLNIAQSFTLLESRFLRYSSESSNDTTTLKATSSTGAIAITWGSCTLRALLRRSLAHRKCDHTVQVRPDRQYSRYQTYTHDANTTARFFLSVVAS